MYNCDSGATTQFYRVLHHNVQQIIIKKEDYNININYTSLSLQANAPVRNTLETDNCTSYRDCTILKQKDSIKSITPAKGVKIISKLRTSIQEKMENLLLMWLGEKQLAGDTVTEAIV